MPSEYRAAFANSLSGFKPANLIGTVNSRGQTNLAIMTSVVHLGSHPPLFMLIVRPGGEDRHTLRNIIETGTYTINHVNAEIIENAHQTAASYHAYESEFAKTGLIEEWLGNFSAPFVKQAKIKMAMQLREHKELSINKTHMVIGEATLIIVPDGSQYENGAVNIVEAGSVAISGLDSYHDPRLIMRLAYAVPDQPPRHLD